MQLPSAPDHCVGTDLSHLREDAASCRRCPLWRNATQTVFGEGPASARMMLVGEQPGDREDLAGRPFIGPAGQILDQEIALLRPRLTVALGATAPGALMRRTVTIGRVRGQAIESESGHLWITVHPSYLLRLPDEASRQREFVRFVKDLEGAKALLASRGKRTS